MQLAFRNRYLLVSDAIILASLPALAYLVRFEGAHWSAADTRTLVLFTLIAVPLKLALFLAGGMYNRLWPQATIGDLIGIVRVGLLCAAVVAVLGLFLIPAAGLAELRVPLSVLAIDAFATVVVISGPRMLAKVLHNPSRALRRSSDPGALIVGAGADAEIIAKETLANPDLGIRLVGFVDDDPAKRSLRLCGLPVLGSLQEIPQIVKAHGVREVIIAMPEAHGRLVRGVVRAATSAGARTRTIPALSEILSDQVSVSALRSVEIQDLLRREPIETDLAPVQAVLTGRTVLITGAGGSIGSELCRQIARLDPDRLLLLGHGENSIFDIRAALQASHPGLQTIPIIADVRDAGRMADIVAAHRPAAIFHAAAHKHVPLMEANVGEAILNNVLGTRNVVEAALAAHTEHLVFISTDKAVRPCSVMGLTKRVAELVVQYAALEHDRNFVSVRFGNVLGSRGSVVPAFLQQIKAGGPVLVTHPDMRRFFMTIPEAVQLVLQAGALGRCGEVFVLDMGEPVRIVDLARDLIRLSGLAPDDDIEIRFTGLRAGERLDEELLISGERLAPTPHPKLLRAMNGHLAAGVASHIDMLVSAAMERQPDAILRLLLAGLVPEATMPAPARSVDVLEAAAVSVISPNGNGHAPADRVGAG